LAQRPCGFDPRPEHVFPEPVLMSRRRNPKSTPPAQQKGTPARPTPVRQTPRGPTVAGLAVLDEEERADSLASLGRVAILCLALSLIYFFPTFLPDRQIGGTDYTSSGYFFQEFLAQRFNSGVLPKWVPYIYGGLPLYSNPGATYYPIRLIAEAVLPVDRVLAMIFVVQFTIAGIGFYLLMRELGVRRWISTVTAIAFQFTGLVASYVYAGHDGRVIAATFTPLFFFLLHRGVRTGELRWFAGAAAAIGTSLLSFQIQSNYYLLVAAALWTIFALFNSGLHKTPAVFAARAGLAIVAVAIGFTLASVNFLPFLGYVDEASRGPASGRGYRFAISYSMPIKETLGLAVPEQAGILRDYQGLNPFKLHTEYVGAAVLLLLFAGAGMVWRDKRWRFFAGLTLFTLSICYGGYTPLYRLYYALLPGTNKFRAPSIALYLVSFSLAVMAALAFEEIARRRTESRSGRGADSRSDAESVAAFAKQLLIVAIISVAAATLAFVLSADTESHVLRGWARFGMFLGATALLLRVWLSARLTTRTFAILLSLVVITDLWIIDKKFLMTVEPPDELLRADDVVDYLKSQPNNDRVWVFPLPMQQTYLGNDRFGPQTNYLMHFDIEQAGGEHGNQLQRWNEYLGTGNELMSVSWENFLQYEAFLAAANIGYVIAAVDLSVDPQTQAPTGFQKAFVGRTAAVFRVTRTLPRVYLAPEVRIAPNKRAAMAAMRQQWNPTRVAIVEGAKIAPLPSTELTGTATLDSHTDPDRVEVTTETNRRALLVLADNYSRGWKATVDGAPVPILRANYTFRGVIVDAGRHHVAFTFHPDSLYHGLYISLAALILLVGYGVWLVVDKRRSR
jgi:hypothetical protein